MAEPITGKNAEFTLDSALGVPTDISDFISGITKASDTEEFPTRIFKRTRVVQTPGFKTEDWEVKGPWSADAEAFWRPLAGKSAGVGIDYILKPDADASFAWVGTTTVKHYEADSVDAAAVITYTARLSILTKVEDAIT